MNMFREKSVLVTGGTGSFGKHFVKKLLSESDVKRVVVLSRDELKQFEMRRHLDFASESSRLRFFVGDVRDGERLRRAFKGIDYVVHAAAMKQVPTCEYNPFEAIKTNIHGAQNVIDAAIDSGVSRVIALSTDKACNPANLYGATKLASDKLFVSGNAYVGSGETRFSVVRYGNVVGSRGSVVPFFLRQRETGVLPITDHRMTRFWITLDQGVRFVLQMLETMRGGEIFVPKIPSMKITDLARAIGPGCRLEEIGIRPGEKLHEVMVSEDDARHTVELDTYYAILPEFEWWASQETHGRPCPEGFRYSSETNTEWLDGPSLQSIVKPFEDANG
ncbi:MAG: UDP-N-acetylglucosamine 4,6-dehydratase (inverting) [Myxococcota bacterium]